MHLQGSSTVPHRAVCVVRFLCIFSVKSITYIEIQALSQIQDACAFICGLHRTGSAFAIVAAEARKGAGRRKARGMGQSERAFDEIALEPISNGIEAAKFLASLVSVFFLTAPLLVAASLVLSLNGLSLAAPLTAGAIMLSFAAWAWSIAQIRPLPILAGALVWSSGLALATGAQVLQLPKGADWFVWGFVIAATLVALAFALRIVIDAWQLARIRADTRALVAAAAPNRVRLTGVLARIVGIHPICAWLPGVHRRVLAAVLFMAVTFVVSSSVGLAIYARSSIATPQTQRRYLRPASPEVSLMHPP